jgi:hypothetical protein
VELALAAGEVTTGEVDAGETAVVNELASLLRLAAGTLVELETASAAGFGATAVAATGAASESAGVVWALPVSAVNNKARAKTVLLVRLARLLLWLSIFPSPLK